MSLFTFTDTENIVENGKTIKDGAQIIKPTKQHVNVVADYAWTIQPKSARKDVPFLYMIERKLTNDVMIQQLLYTLSAAFETGNQTAEEFFKKLSEKIDDQKLEANEAQIRKNQVEQGEQNAKNLNDAESPYTGLYSLEDTGWSYVLPYFDKRNHNIGGNWGLPSDSGSFINRIIGGGTDIVADLAGGVNQIVSALGAATGNASSVRAGTYIERAKQYNFEAKGPSYSLQFNLYNTGHIQDVIDNWELCFALMYNLLPNRRTKTVFDPPPLYEIYIPGVRRSPVSFIKGMRVDFLGATRLMDLQVAGVDKLRTIVPDAYSLTIDIEDVLPESKNFMESMINSEKRVKVSSKTETVSRTVEQDFETKSNDITHITLNPTQKQGVNSSGNNNPTENFANETIGEPFKKAQRSIQRTTNDLGRIPRGRF